MNDSKETVRRPGVLIGDPIIPVGDGFMVLNGYGDYRVPSHFAAAILAAAKEAEMNREVHAAGGRPC